MTPPTRILDSHIHLWPHTSTNPAGHAWMAPGGPLTKQHSLRDYSAAAPSPALRGAVYVETDRTLAGDRASPIAARAAQPLAELRWLRRLVAGAPAHGEAFAPGDGDVLWGLVPWAPVDVAPGVLKEYLGAAEEAAGPEAWGRVRGWRFLVQGIRDEEAFGGVVGGEEWVGCLRECGRRGWCFDVGVDSRGVGVWQVERVVEAVERVNREGEVGVGEEVRFVLSEFASPVLVSFYLCGGWFGAFGRYG
ncbi:Amidohydrolase [Neofusicoccum parvum]|uniref:Amidohydrolase n=1 Tax=Neofusicoccum parvum TaxID=310453 RepID=A0ACB5S489_9PEZI|nr:Amidohydrolase [Neofusicoccum parvum]